MAHIRHLDLDSFFDPTWTAEYGNRVFYFDAFLSHNRADNSPSLKSKLEEVGLRIWHDSDADLRSRKVRVRVNEALRNSRFVVVCIHDTFVDSLWCRAEYLSALELGKHSGIQRVLVAQMSRSIVLPAVLQASPIFDCTQQIPAAMLDLLRDGNRLAFDPGPVLQAPSTLPMAPSAALQAVILEALDWQWQTDDFGVDPERDARYITSKVAAAFLARSDAGDLDVCGQKVQVYRSMLCRIPSETARGWPLELRQAICDFAGFVARSSDRDDRANALYVLEWLANTGPRQAALAGISEMLRTDTDPVVLAEAVRACGRLRLGPDEVSKEVLQLAFLRGSSRLGPDSTLGFGNSLPDSVRLRCALKGELIDASFLTAAEQLLLIEQRVGFILENSVYLDPDGIRDQVRLPLEISDLELELRSLRHVMQLFREVPEEEAAQLRARVVSLIRSVATVSEQNQGQPLLAVGDWVLEYVLYPLLTCLLSAPALRDTAADAYRQVCSVMSTSPKYSREVTVYLAGLDVALASNNFSQATETIERGLLRVM